MAIRISLGLQLAHRSAATPQFNVSGAASIDEFTAAGVVDAFSPSSIAGLVLWYDLQDAASFTESAGTLTSITNKASSVVHNTGTLPTYSATNIGGTRPGLSFATNRYIDNTEAAIIAALANGQAYTAFFVVDDTTDANHAWLASGNATDGQGRKIGMTSAGLGRITQQTVGSTTDAINDAVDYDHNNPHVVEWYGSTSSAANIDGTARVPNAVYGAAYTTATRVSVGSRPLLTRDQFATMKLGSILLYNSILDSTNRALVRNYLGTKWGITVV